VVNRLSVEVQRKMNFILDFSLQIDQSYKKTSIVFQRSMHFVAKPSKDPILSERKIIFQVLKE